VDCRASQTAARQSIAAAIWRELREPMSTWLRNRNHNKISNVQTPMRTAHLISN
jgi:hypothetical protein